MHKVNNKHCRTGQRKCLLELKYSLNQSKDLAQAASAHAWSAFTISEKELALMFQVTW